MKTSVWLSDDIAERWKKTGLPLAEFVKRGLDAGEPEPLDDKISRLLAERLAEAGQPATAAEVREIIREEINAVLDRLDGKPDTIEVRAIIRAELERATGQSHD